MNYSKIAFSLLTLPFFLLTFNFLFAQAPDTLWTKTYGGAKDDVGRSVQQTTDGSYIIAGWTNSFGAGGYDVYLIKTNQSGDTLWTKTYGREYDDFGYEVQLTSDNGYIITGYTFSPGINESDVYLVKTDANGDALWTRVYGWKGEDRAYSVKQALDGGYIIAGETNSFGNHDYDVYLIKTDADGDIEWTKTYDAYLNEAGYSVQQTSDSGYIVAGESGIPNDGACYVIKVDANGETLWTEMYWTGYSNSCYSVQQTSDGGYALVGYTSSVGPTSYDVYLIKTDALGDTLFTKTYGGKRSDQGYSVQETFDGGFIITGFTQSYGAGWLDVYLLKTDIYGVLLWTSTSGGSAEEIGYSVKQTSDGGYIIAGYTGSFGAGDNDVYLIKTESDVKIEGQQGPKVKSQELKVDIYPNPFRDKTNIRLHMPDGRGEIEDFSLKIYNITGRLIKSFPQPTPYPQCRTQITWTGRDEQGKRLASGVYFLKLKVGDLEETKKLILLE